MSHSPTNTLFEAFAKLQIPFSLDIDTDCKRIKDNLVELGIPEAMAKESYQVLHEGLACGINWSKMPDYDMDSVIGTIQKKTALDKEIVSEVVSAVSDIFGLPSAKNFPKGDVEDGVFCYTGDQGITEYEIPRFILGDRCIYEMHSVISDEIWESAFEGCKSLVSVTIPDSITTIGLNAFRRCESLVSVTIPNSVTKICSDAFSGCTSLESITIPDSVTVIGEAAFAGCISLQSIKIPDSILEIGDYAFVRCNSLKSVTIPDSVSRIGFAAFLRCASLESVTIPGSVTRIEWKAFGECPSLESITVADDNAAYCDLGGVLYDKDRTLLIQYPPSKPGKTFTVPDSVKTIEYCAFEGCTSLESVTIPDSVTKICTGAFSGCTSLESVTIPDSISRIGSNAFMRCASLESVTIPGSVTMIELKAFGECPSLESITVADDNAAYCDLGGVLYDKDRTLLIQYPPSKPGKTFTVPDSVKTIEYFAFEGCTSLESVTIPGSVTEYFWGGFEANTEIIWK